MAEYTISRLEELGYRGYVRKQDGSVEESRFAMTVVVVMANWNRYHLEYGIQSGKRIIRVRQGLYTETYPEIWIEKELKDDKNCD